MARTRFSRMPMIARTNRQAISDVACEGTRWERSRLITVPATVTPHTLEGDGAATAPIAYRTASTSRGASCR